MAEMEQKSPKPSLPKRRNMPYPHSTKISPKMQKDILGDRPLYLLGDSAF